MSDESKEMMLNYSACFEFQSYSYFLTKQTRWHAANQ